jgi:hypothetical protein
VAAVQIHDSGEVLAAILLIAGSQVTAQQHLSPRSSGAAIPES